MADLDTRNKRGSALMVDLSFGRIWPDPDGSISVLDRQQSAYKYEGVSASTVAVVHNLPLMGMG